MKVLCAREDLNLHALIRARAPQASASTYSATRTKVSPPQQMFRCERGGNCSKELEQNMHRPWPPPACKDGPMSVTPDQTPAAPAYDPAAEVVEICRDLLRIDTTNYDRTKRMLTGEASNPTASATLTKNRRERKTPEKPGSREHERDGQHGVGHGDPDLPQPEAAQVGGRKQHPP